MGPEELPVARVAEDFAVGAVGSDGVVEQPAALAAGEALPVILSGPHREHFRRKYLAGTTRAPGTVYGPNQLEYLSLARHSSLL